ncbi:TPA: cation transporter, partial [Legionella bozemanae]
MKLIKKFVTLFFLIIFLSTIVTPMVFGSEDDNQQSEAQEEFEKGPQGGRLFKKDSITLELLLFERGMPPHFRAYLYQEGKTISPNSSQLTAELTRFNGKKEVITFRPVENFLQSNQMIKEPHSFDVSLQLRISEKSYNWQYNTYEGRLKLVPAILQAANIQTEKAESQTIKTQLKVVGKIAPNRDTMAPIYARYAGIIKLMNKNLGDEVIKGDLLAT